MLAKVSSATFGFLLTSYILGYPFPASPIYLHPYHQPGHRLLLLLGFATNETIRHPVFQGDNEFIIKFCLKRQAVFRSSTEGGGGGGVAIVEHVQVNDSENGIEPAREKIEYEEEEKDEQKGH